MIKQIEEPETILSFFKTIGDITKKCRRTWCIDKVMKDMAIKILASKKTAHVMSLVGLVFSSFKINYLCYHQKKLAPTYFHVL